MVSTVSGTVEDHEFSQKSSGSAAVLLRPATRRVFPPPFTRARFPSQFSRPQYLMTLSIQNKRSSD